MWSLAAIGCLLILLYSCTFVSPPATPHLGHGNAAAGAALLSGFLLGFIFAIRALESKGESRNRPAE